jgi:hypothetical protein
MATGRAKRRDTPFHRWLFAGQMLEHQPDLRLVTWADIDLGTYCDIAGLVAYADGNEEEEDRLRALRPQEPGAPPMAEYISAGVRNAIAEWPGGGAGAAAAGDAAALTGPPRGADLCPPTKKAPRDSRVRSPRGGVGVVPPLSRNRGGASMPTPREAGLMATSRQKRRSYRGHPAKNATR